MDPLILRLPFPPSANTYWRKGWYWNNGKKISAMMISAAGRRYRDEVAHAILNQYRRLRPQTFTAEVSIAMVLFPPDRRRRDQDNYRKGLWDALTHAGVWRDDSQVKHDEAWTGEVVKGGACMVQIRRLTEKTIPAWADKERDLNAERTQGNTPATGST